MFYTIVGVSRNISVNANGDVHTDMMILDMNPETGKFVVGSIQMR